MPEPTTYKVPRLFDGPRFIDEFEPRVDHISGGGKIYCDTNLDRFGMPIRPMKPINIVPDPGSHALPGHPAAPTQNSFDFGRTPRVYAKFGARGVRLHAKTDSVREAERVPSRKFTRSRVNTAHGGCLHAKADGVCGREAAGGSEAVARR